jgi:protein-S-isoprenylcysteine O-methyltransferase Ste14
MHIVWSVRYDDTIAIVVFVLVLLSWLVFAGIFLSHRRPPPQESVKKDRRSSLGILLQGVAFFFMWAIQRPKFSPIVPMTRVVEVVVGALTVALAAGSVWLVLIAVRTLGKQWAYTARVIEGHTLVTDGPYRWVRNPIYAGMLGLLLATGLAQSHWIGLLPALIFFAIGTAIRVRSEERLLRDTFGAEFDRYAARVPAVLPAAFRVR